MDRGAAFLELSPLAACDLYDGGARGRYRDRDRPRPRFPCVIVANDATVKGGTYFPVTVKKHLRAQEIALENRLPCIYLVDSGGRTCRCRPRSSRSRPLRAHLLQPGPHVGGRHPPDRGGDGLVHRRGAYVPAMSDETVIVRGTGTIFLGGPPLVKAATGEDVDPQELGGADVHARRSGVADHEAADDEHALRIVREVVANLNLPDDRAWQVTDPVDPAVDPAGLYGAIPKDLSQTYDVREVVARIVDGSAFHEFKQLYGDTLVCGFARIHGHPVAILANNGILFSESALKGALRAARVRARHAARLPAEHHGLHRGARIRGGRHREGRREARDRSVVRERAEVHRDHRRIVRRRELRDERPRVRAETAVDVAERASR